MTQDDIRLVLEYVKVLAWPLLIGWAIWHFRSEIAGLLKRIADKIEKIEDVSIGPLKMRSTPGATEAKEAVDVDLKSQRSSSKYTEWVVDQANKKLVQARNASAHRDHRTAINALREANCILPNQWPILHNLAVELIREGDPEARKTKKRGKIESFIQAESVCRNALTASGEFPWGTFYNLARAQALGNNITGLRETLSQMYQIADSMPEHLAAALAKDEPDRDVAATDELKSLVELEALRRKLKGRFNWPTNG